MLAREATNAVRSYDCWGGARADERAGTTVVDMGEGGECTALVDTAVPGEGDEGARGGLEGAMESAGLLLKDGDREAGTRGVSFHAELGGGAWSSGGPKADESVEYCRKRSVGARPGRSPAPVNLMY